MKKVKEIRCPRCGKFNVITHAWNELNQVFVPVVTMCLTRGCNWNESDDNK